MAIAALALAPAVAAAQGAPVGEMTFRFTGKAPAAMTAQAPMPIERMPMFMVKMASDGKQMGMEMTLQGTESAPPFDMIADTRLRILWRAGSDSVRFLAGVPASMRGMAASMLAPDAGAEPPAGYYMVMKVPNLDSIMDANKGKVKDRMDSADDGPEPTVTSLGTKSTVAGIQCENWRVVAPDSARTKSDTVELCMVEGGMTQLGIGAWLADRFDLDDAMKDADVSKYFGGRAMYPIRVTTSDNSFLMELVSASNTAPAASFFSIPADYRAIDPKTIPLPDGINP